MRIQGSSHRKNVSNKIRPNMLPQGHRTLDVGEQSPPVDLEVCIGQYSVAGKKEVNQDFYGAILPGNALRSTKGIAIAIADGISSSKVGHVAAHACVVGFLEDYFCTPESWSVRTSAEKVLNALNGWLYAQGGEHPHGEEGLISTLSALVIKSNTAHLFHVGDTRIYRMRDDAIEQLTTDHRIWVSGEKGILSRAMGADRRIEVDYIQVAIGEGDLFLLSSDGVHDHLADKTLVELVTQGNAATLDEAARAICDAALARGSSDNLTCQLLRILRLPVQGASEVYQVLQALPFPPQLEPGMMLDGYRILRELHASQRTQVYLALDAKADTRVVLKTPAMNFQAEPAYLERVLLEEWIARRIDSPHVLKVHAHGQRNFLYLVTEYLEGQTLRQWMHDHPERTFEEVRDIVQQIGKGLQAFHRMEMVHQDLQPENLMIDRTGTVKIVDFGSTKVAGIDEMTTPTERVRLLGTRNYTAPEYLFQQPGSTRSDLYSMGVIAYELFTGQLPYGDLRAGSHSAVGPSAKDYIPAQDHNPAIPRWIDGALRKAVHPDPRRRYVEASEFLYDLRHPNPTLAHAVARTLVDRNLLGFWRGLAILLLLLNLVLLYIFTQ